MIVLKSIGGLGNQMFEYAYARNLQLQLNDSDLQIDTTVYRKYKIREYDLDSLNVNYSSLDQGKFYEYAICLSYKTYHLVQYLKKRFFKSPFLGENIYKFLARFGLYYNFDFKFYKFPGSNELLKKKYVYGYFQSEKYFIENKSIICSELKVKTIPTYVEQEYLRSINSYNSVGVSIRIGEDYSSDSLIYVCSPEYFYTAMRKMKNQFPDCRFYVFTDNIDTVKRLFNFEFEVTYIENMNAVQSLRLLYNCKNFILSNSSFSWWGSYLSNNPKKIAYVPAKFSTNLYLDDSDIFTDYMIKIDEGVIGVDKNTKFRTR